MDIFNNREIAILIWLGGLAAFAFSKQEIRKSSIELLAIFLNWKIWSPMLLLIAYIAIWVFLLSIPGIWEIDQLKNTVIWTVFVALVSMTRVATKGENPQLLKNWVSDNLKIMVAVEFVVNMPTFSLLGELVFIPVTAILAVLQVLAEYREEHKALLKPINGMLGIVVIALISYAVYTVYDDFEAFATMQTARDFYTPLLLSFLVIPFYFVFYAVVSYETAFIRVSFAIQDKKLQSYAFRWAVIEFWHHIDLLKRWTRNIAMSHPADKSAIRKSIREVKELWRRECNPPAVLPGHGWSPYAAIGFLKTVGLEASDYHSSLGEWFASSPYLNVGNGILQDNIAYYIDGNENAATQLKLVLNVNCSDTSDLSEITFRDVVSMLIETALPGIDAEAVFSQLNSDDAQVTLANKKISLLRDNWAVGKRNGYCKKFVIEHLAAS